MRSAIAGAAPAAWAIGAAVQAQYSADGQWYPGTVQAATTDGKLVVLYEGYNSSEELPLTAVRLKEEEEDEEGCAAAGRWGLGPGAGGCGWARVLGAGGAARCCALQGRPGRPALLQLAGGLSLPPTKPAPAHTHTPCAQVQGRRGAQAQARG